MQKIWWRGNCHIGYVIAKNDLHCQTQTLEDNLLHIQQRQQETNMVDELEVLDPQSLSDEIWQTPILENFNPPSLAITGAPDSLKWKLLSDTYKDTSLRWYMSLPKLSITNY